MAIFDEKLKEFFSATSGAFSEVTKREATGDKSVTVDKHEKSVLALCYSMEEFARAGGVEADGKLASKLFNIFDMSTGTFQTKELAIKYPKSKGNELRLYFNRPSGFYPVEANVWFIFVREGVEQPFLGFDSLANWKAITDSQDISEVYEVEKNIDDEDFQYQLQIGLPEESKEAQSVQVLKYPRSSALAKSCIKQSDYSCEVSEAHKTFISALTGKQYVEAHHLIPMSKTKDFDNTLDTAANIVVLCPNCHSAIHYGAWEIKKDYLEYFYHQRKEGLESSGLKLTLDQLLDFYRKK